MIARVTLPSGRVVLDTGKVRIGILAQQHRPAEQGSHALMLQRVLCTPIEREWHETPRVVRLRPPLWQRLARIWSER